MSSTPEWDAPGQWGGTQQSAHPSESTGTPQGAAPGQGGPTPYPGGVKGDQRAGGGPGQQWGNQGWANQPGSVSPVDRAETKVTGRRVIQFIIDSILAGIIPGIAFWLFDRGHGVWHSLGWLFAAAIWVVVMIWYWVVRPTQHNGQTFAMKWMGLRVVSKIDGGPANMTQMFVRWIALIFDSWILSPLVGYIVILCSRYRQRIGDHLAKTLVISAGYAHYGAGQQYGGQQYGGQQYGGQQYAGQQDQPEPQRQPEPQYQPGQPHGPGQEQGPTQQPGPTQETGPSGQYEDPGQPGMPGSTR